ncbi:MAG TPA: ABC transporter permease [Polyangia bacterium]|jgi:phospholipid/cholesterol/gamma-HCH transport system permease protein
MTPLELVRTDETTLELRLVGKWSLLLGLPSTDELEHTLATPPRLERLIVDGRALAAWDSTLVAFVQNAVTLARSRGLAVDLDRLPDGVRRLLALASAARRSDGKEPGPPHPPWLARVGLVLHRGLGVVAEVATFVGQATLSLLRFARGRARYRGVDLLTEIEGAGADALVIVTVVSFLLGMILAFVGGVTLRPFGATIYVANVVAVAVVRELGPIMTAIVMAGRTGSSYAAQLGTMRVTQEVDALTTMGLEPFDFLVLPRLLALALMMPLLGVYADFVAVAGGGLIAVTMPDVTVRQYLLQTRDALTLTTFWLGLVKSGAFGILVALAGCAQGMRAGKSAAAVGQATTRAVVSSIVGIIVVDGIFAVLFYLSGV